MGDTLQWLRIAKRDGYIPKAWREVSRFNAGNMKEWLAPYPEEPTDGQCALIEATLATSIVAAYEGGMDFDDQIYMPVCFGAAWPQYPLVMIDEFQDLNALQHEMLANLATRRLIGVGDPWQSIYGFRGAVQGGMAAAADRWNMRQLTFSTTFRVPRLGRRASVVSSTTYALARRCSLTGTSKRSKHGTRLTFQMVPRLYAALTLHFSMQAYGYWLEADTSNS